MFGFVDVSTMSDLEVKHLSQRDEPQVTSRNSRRSRYVPPPVVLANTIDVFVAAAVAHRINEGEYVKAGSTVPDPENGPYAYKPHPKVPNRTLAEQVISGSIPVEDQDRELAKSVITYYKGLTMRLLSGKLLSEFDQKVLQMASSETMNVRDIAVVASLPSCYTRAAKRQSVEDRLYDCEKSHIGQIGNKVVITGEVVRCVFSQQWNTHYITIITDTNHSVFFGNRNQLKVGSTVKVAGNVKAHRDNFQTQLNYTKII